VQNRRAHRESLDIAVVRPSQPVNVVLDVGVARRQRTAARLDVGMLSLPRGTFSPRFRGRFAGKHAIGIGDFNVIVRIGGKDIPMCELAESMKITHGENENYRCEFVLRKNRPNGTPQRIDPYQWHTKAITVHLRHERGEQILYRGVVDGIKLNALKGTLSVKCSDRRERMINALSWQTIRNIGYTSKAIHGEFADKLDELTKRLETVPASFEFDLNQTGYLNSWLPQRPDFVLDPCFIYQREPSVSLAEARSVINEVKIDLGFGYSRLIHRVMLYQMNVNINVCDYAAYVQLPSLEALQAAAGQTGWVLGGFDLEREARSGWHNCGAGRPLGHLRPDDSTLFVGGSFEMMKRWTQPVNEQYQMVLRHQPSIRRYELGSQTLSYNLSAESVSDWDNADYDPHKKGLQFKFASGERLFAHSSGIPFYKNSRLRVAPNGDYFFDADNNGAGLQEALQTAWWTGYVKMLASHRQNTVDLQIKLLPAISLRHTHRIEHSHFKGNAKVSRFEHTFNFRNGRGETAVQYRFFQSGGNSGLSDFQMPKRPQFEFAKRQQYLWLGKVELAENQQVGDHWGMIYRLAAISHRTRLYQPVAFRIYVPDVEKQSTDTATAKSHTAQNVAIPDNPITMLI
ncbi:hypothetical protein, partial [Conchiformibius steedae]|uniref:hypothetical protein n=1 Tax=Conchiformibius steedae TaxID=153493 RepID=UPI0026EA9FA0